MNIRPSLFILGTLFVAAVAVAVPPTQQKMYDMLTQGLTGDPERKTDVTDGLTCVTAIDNEVPVSQRNDAYTQFLVVSNKDTAENICVGTREYTGLLSLCSTRCAQGAGVVTCDGSSTDGSYVFPGQQRSFRYDGSRCVCIRGAAGGTEFQAERIVR